ncbi:MAG: substrate-binding domain-containing protein [Oscillospiraceae bacterium]|nr:substrate-binding domain-containing protein [Oscillospiraceae bacterium]
MPRRRIAVITARADDAEQKEILGGIAEAAFAADTDIAVYSNIYNHWVVDEQLNFENIIYALFEPRHYDGAIITAEAFMDIGILNKVKEKIRRSKLPAVVINGKIEGFKSIFSDDEYGMEKITEHLITVHGCTDIDFLCGRENDPITEMRISGCKKAFEKHGIPFDNSKIYYGNFWNDSGEALARRYISGELPLPQAVVCANDFMAYGLCDVLAEAGISIPEKLAVAGYDHTGGRIYHYPLLTSYRRNRRKTGADAVNMLLGTNYASNIGERLVSGNTCPCGTNTAGLNGEFRTERLKQQYDIISSVAQFASRLTLCRTLAEYTAVLSSFFYLLHDAEELYLCLDAAWNSAKFEGEEYLFCKITEERADSNLIRLGKAELPPTFYETREKPAVFYFSPVHFQTRLFGYTVLKFSCPTGYDFSFRDWNKNVANTLEFLRMKNDIHYLAQCQRASSLYDSLTGFYNLGEFRRTIETADTESNIFAVKLSFAENGEYFYGENYRSDIIATAAKAIKQTCTERDIYCRAYEDMFLILYRGKRDIFKDKLKVMLHGAMCGKYDERQVLISCAEYHGAPDEQGLNRLCGNAVRIAEEDAARVAEKNSLQHYNALMDIRNGIMFAPRKTPTLSEVSRKLCVSEGHFRLIYKRCFGVSYNQDCINAKMLKACYLLCTTSMSVYAAAKDCGYADEKYFTRLFKQNVGCSPAQYRKRIC